MTEEGEDEKMLEYMKALGVPPMKDIEDFKRFMTEYGVTKVTDPTETTKKSEDKTTLKTKIPMNPPCISIFFGEEGKGDVSYQTWAYEVQCLKSEKIYPDEILLQSIRRCLRGHAADQLRYIGLKLNIEEILDTFHSTYGLIETPESILQKFYACKQKPTESVLNYCIRLEEIHSQAIQMKVLNEVDGMLKCVFYRGLTPQLKHLSAFKFETVPDYRNFKKEVRQIENEIKEDENTTQQVTKVKCSSINKKDEKCEINKTEQQFNELTSMLQQLNTRMEQLEKKQEMSAQCQQAQSSEHYMHQQTHPDSRQTNNANHNSQPHQYSEFCYTSPQAQHFRPVGWRGPKHFRGPRSHRPRGQGPFRGQGRGNNSYRFQRPIAGNTFIPECYACHQLGHMARDCPLNM